MNKIRKCLEMISILGIICWAIIAIIILQWKNLYYYPQYDLYLYVDGGIVGNRTVIMGQSLDSMNTILRYESRDVFNFYIGKVENHFYIYWPEDTTSYHYTSIKSDSLDSFKSYPLKEVKYLSYLKYYKLDGDHFSLVTFQHQTPEDWIDTYEAWSDGLHWGSPGQLKIFYDTRISSDRSSNSCFMSSGDITIVDCDASTYIRLLIKTLDNESVAFIVALFFFIIIYVLCFFLVPKEKKLSWRRFLMNETH